MSDLSSEDWARRREFMNKLKLKGQLNTDETAELTVLTIKLYSMDVVKK